MKHNVMKFLLSNLGYTHHAIQMFGYVKSAIKHYSSEKRHSVFSFSAKMGTGRLK